MGKPGPLVGLPPPVRSLDKRSSRNSAGDRAPLRPFRQGRKRALRGRQHHMVAGIPGTLEPRPLNGTLASKTRTPGGAAEGGVASIQPLDHVLPPTYHPTTTYERPDSHVHS